MSQLRAVVSDVELCAYVDGEMTPERRIEVDAFLAGRPDARAKVEGWRRQGHLLRASFGRIAQEPLPRQMVAALAQAATPTPIVDIVRAAPPPRAPAPLGLAPALRASPPRTGWRNAALATLAVSAALAVIVVNALQQSGAAAGGRESFGSSAPGYGLTRHAAEAHAAFAPRADRLLDVRGGDPAALSAAALAAGLDARLPIPAAGLRLLGLRLTPGDSGLSGLLLFDTDKNGRVSLLVARGGRGAAPGLVLRESDGLTVASFHVDGNSYALTGAAPRDQMVDWASALRLSLVQPRSLRGS